MNQSEATREAFFSSNLDEPRRYRLASRNWFTRRLPLRLPLTYSGLQALLLYASAAAGTPADDAATAILCGYVHHIPGNIDYTTFQTVVRLLRKSFSNNMTWNVDQGIKLAARAAATAPTPPPPAGPPASAGPEQGSVPPASAGPEQGSVPPANPKPGLTLVPTGSDVAPGAAEAGVTAPTPSPTPRDASNANQDSPEGQ
jgi:hypothetical protein